MPTPKFVTIRKNQDFFPTVLGLHVLKMIKAGYYKFEIVESDDEKIVIKALRRRGRDGG